MTKTHTDPGTERFEDLRFSRMDEFASPGLVFYRERIAQNLDRMIEIAGAPDGLVPHIKTIKCPQVIKMMVERGIRRFKCATIAEAEIAAGEDAQSVLVAHQLVAPQPQRLLQLAASFPDTEFSTVVDDADHIERLNDIVRPTGRTLRVYLDLDVGMARTGVPAKLADPVHRAIQDAACLEFAGFHVYDGHIRARDPKKREKDVEKCYAAVLRLAERLHPEEIIAGGSGSFPVHARHPDRLLSPGTTVLSDWRTSREFPDLGMSPAAFVMTRVISRTGEDKLTLDLGHKAIASENPPDSRALFFGPNHDGAMLAEVAVHSEEHLTLRSPRAGAYKVGDTLFALPFHICPTVALHQEAIVVEDRRVVATWPITARDRRIRY
ncbi:MAG: alanine racemase [Planctomycetota bacterium]